MNEEKSIAICPKCHLSDKVIKYGVRNNIQRYRCKRCNHVFAIKRKRIKYSANKKTLLALLISLLRTEDGKIINDTFENVKEIIKEIDDFQLIEMKPKNENVIFCKNPCLLLCDNGDDIVIYRLNKQHKTTRETKIIDEAMKIL